MNFLGRHFWMALLLHAVLLALLSVSVRCSKPPAMPVVIEAVLLDPSREQQAVRRQQERKQREADRAEAERLQQEQARLEQEKLETKKQELAQETERQRRLDEEQAIILKKKKDAVDQIQKQEQIKQRQQKDIEEKKRLDEQKKKEAAALKKQQDQDRRLELEREDELMRQQLLAREDDERRAAQVRRQQDSARDAWIAQISLHIAKNWLRPPDTQGRVRCTVEIKQLPGGQIVSKRIVKSCGSTALNDSVLRAIGKSDPLPLPSDPAIFDRELVVNFEPNDE